MVGGRRRDAQRQQRAESTTAFHCLRTKTTGREVPDQIRSDRFGLPSPPRLGSLIGSGFGYRSDDFEYVGIRLGSILAASSQFGRVALIISTPGVYLPT